MWEESCGSWSEKEAEGAGEEGQLQGEEGTSAVAGRKQGARGGSWSLSIKDAGGWDTVTASVGVGVGSP